MPYGAHETMEVHEMLNEKINMINHFALYQVQCQDQKLRQLIDRHLQTAIQAYDQLVNYTHDYNAASRMRHPAGMPQSDPGQIQYGLNNPAEQAPMLQRGRLNDQQIMMAMLACHKNSARNHMHASLECADPNLRQMLLNSAATCANQSYELFLMMNQQGAYQVPTMHDHTAKTYLHAYQPSNEAMMANTGGMQGMNGMQNPGNMNAGSNPSMNTPMNSMAGMQGMNGSAYRQ